MDELRATPPFDRQVAELAKRQHGVVSVRQLAALGLGRGAVHARVKAGRLHRIHAGVHAVGHARLSLRGRWMAAVLALGRGALLSHRDGAALLDLRAVWDGPIDVTIDSSSGRRRRPGIAIHRARLHLEDRTVRDGIPVASPSRTLLDLAEVVSPTQLQRAYERAARVKLLDVAAIERLLERSRGRRGVGVLGALIGYDPAAAAQAKSELEVMFLDLIRKADLPVPQVNVLVEGLEVDAHWPDARLVIELDSWAFHGNRGAFERDHEKIGRLQVVGYRVLPLTYRQVAYEHGWVADAVRRLLAGTAVAA